MENGGVRRRSCSGSGEAGAAADRKAAPAMHDTWRRALPGAPVCPERCCEGRRSTPPRSPGPLSRGLRESARCSAPPRCRCKRRSADGLLAAPLLAHRKLRAMTEVQRSVQASLLPGPVPSGLLPRTDETTLLDRAMSRYADGDDAAFSQIFSALAPRLQPFQ